MVRIIAALSALRVEKFANMLVVMVTCLMVANIVMVL